MNEVRIRKVEGKGKGKGQKKKKKEKSLESCSVYQALDFLRFRKQNKTKKCVLLIKASPPLPITFDIDNK